MINNDDLKVPRNWSLLWNLKVPPKFKHFLWRVLRGCHPTRVKLQDKGVSYENLCSYCNTNLENSWHIFFGYKQVHEYWRTTRVWSYISNEVQIAKTIKGSVFKLLHKLSQSIQVKFVMLLWNIWHHRNDKIWNYIDPQYQVSINLTM